MKKLLLLLMVPAGLAALLFLAMQRFEFDLTEPPKRGGAPGITPEVPLSVVTLNAAVPLARLQQLANREIPALLVREKRKKRWKGKFLGIKTSISADVMLRVERRGKPQVKYRGSELRLRVPMKFKARIKFRGGIRPNTSTSGRFTVEARLRIGLTPDWRPKVRVEGDYEWDKRPRIGSGPFSVDIADAVGEKLEKAIQRGAEKLEEDLEEDLDIREKAERAWLDMQQPRRLSDDEPLWLLVKPESVHLKPLHRDGDSLKLSFALAARLQTVLGEPPAQGSAVPLPDLSPDLPAAEEFVVDVPVLASYGALEALLVQRAAGKAFDLRGGQFTATGFDVYGSAGQLVLGTAFSAHPPWRLLRTRGTVWLMGRPEFDRPSETLVIRDLDFTRRVNNPLVWTASWVLQDRLRAELRQRSMFPLSEKIAEARAGILERMQELSDDEWRIDGRVDELTVVSIEPLADSLYLRLRTRGRIVGEWIPEALKEAK